jgi:ASCH domain
VAKALSVKQPWAWAIIEAGKDVENREKPPPYLGRLFIHAAKEDALEGWHFLDEEGIRLPVNPPTGCIIGSVDVWDCVRNSKSRWAMDGYCHWLLRNPRRHRCVPMSGNLGIFNVDLSQGGPPPRRTPPEYWAAAHS